MTVRPMGPVPDRSSLQTSAIWLIVLGVLCGGFLPMIFGIIALVQLDTDPYSAKTMNKVGWIVFWVSFGLIALGLLLYLGVAVLFFGMALIPVLGS